MRRTYFRKKGRGERAGTSPTSGCAWAHFLTGNVISGENSRKEGRKPFHPFGVTSLPEKRAGTQLPVAHARTQGNPFGHVTS